MLNLEDAGTKGHQDTAWPVMVLAHNEEHYIGKCLDSIFASEPDREFAVYVMANGCTDGTEDLVRAYAKNRTEVHLVSIGLGDKCNAWNVFIHETVPQCCPDSPIYFFMDGDASATPGSFSAMARAMAGHPRANAVSALPVSGRNAKASREAMVAERGLVANLYALRGSLVDRMRQLAVRIPLALEGDDGLIGALAKWDLDPKNNAFDDERIVPCPDAGFKFESMSLSRLRDWRIYWKRAVRYGRRRYEFELLGRRLREQGLSGMPIDIRELYSSASSLALRWDGLYTVPNWFALKQMRASPGQGGGHA